MSLLMNNIRKDAKKIRHGSTEIKSVWWGGIKVWPMAKLYFLNTGDETLEWSISNESAAQHSATSSTQIKLRASKSDIKLPFSYQCSANIRIKSISAVTSGHTVTLSDDGWGATGHITLGNNNYFSSDAVENPDFIITWEVKPNTTLQNQVSTIKFYDLMDIIDNPSNPENCDVDPCTFTLTQRPDTVLWDSSSVVFYTSNACTTKASSYSLNQYTAGNVDVFFRIEAKRESGVTYYYGQGVFGSETTSDLSVSRATTSVATAHTTPAMEGSVYCWKTTISISTNEGCWGRWSEGSISYGTNAAYLANSTQTVTVTHPKRSWIGTNKKTSNVTVTMTHKDEQSDRGSVTATRSGTTSISQNADTRTSSETDDGVAYYVGGGSTDVQSYNIVSYQTATVSCIQGSTATITYSTAGLSGTLYAEFIMDPTYYGGGHLTGQVDTTTTIGANRTKTFTARSTGTATVYIIIRQNTKRKMASSVAISKGNAGNLTVDTSGKLTWGSANGDATQVAWTNPSSPLTLSHTECEYAPATGYDYSDMKSSGKCTASVTVATEKIYMRFRLTTAGNAKSVAETTYADSGSGANGSRTFNLTWKSNLGSWAAWPACTDAVYNIAYNTNAAYSANATQSVTKSTPTRKWNTTTRKDCIVTCDAYCGNDAETRSMTIYAYWAKSNEEATTTATQNGTVRIYATNEITCYQKADSQTNANATAASRGAYQATPKFSISSGTGATVNESSGLVTWSSANGDGTQVEFTSGVSWSDTTVAANTADATSSGKASCAINTSDTIYMYFTLTTAGNAKSCSNTTAAAATNGSRSTTITWKSNKGYYNSWTNNVTMTDQTATFKSGTKSMAKTGTFYQTYNTTTAKDCTVTAYAYAGTTSATRSVTVKVVWTKQGNASSPVSGSTTCEKPAPATQNGTQRRYSEKAYTFTQNADTTGTKSESTYTYTITPVNAGASVNSSTGLVTYTQNGGVNNSTTTNVAYVLGTLSGSITITPTSHKFGVAGGSKEFSVSGVSTNAGTNGSAASARSWTITVTGTDSGLTKSAKLTQSGLTDAQVTAPTPSFYYSWSENRTWSSLSASTGTSSILSATSNACTSQTVGNWGAWSCTGGISYSTNAACESGSTQTVSDTFNCSRTRTVTGGTDTTDRSGTITVSVVASNVSNSVSDKTASYEQPGEKYVRNSDTEKDTAWTYSVEANKGASVNSSGTVTWTSNAPTTPGTPKVTSNGNIGYNATTGTVKIENLSGATYSVTTNASKVEPATISSDGNVTVTVPKNPASIGDWGSWSTSGSLTYSSTGADPCKNDTTSPSSKPSVTRSRTITNSKARDFSVTVSGSNSSNSRSATVTIKGNKSGKTKTATATQNGCTRTGEKSGTITQNGETSSELTSESATITYAEKTDNANCSVNSSTGVVTWSSTNGTSKRSVTIKWSSSSGSKSGEATAYQKANSWTASALTTA